MTMLKLLIVDDEPEIVDGIYSLISDNDSGVLDIVKCYSGVEAYEYLKEQRCDIVISDIRMPMLDGFQLKEKLERLWPDTEFLFLTGFNDFDYVYKAIQSENVRYLLKTEDDQVILDTIGEVLNKISEKRKHIELMKQADEILERSKPFITKEFLSTLVKGKKVSKSFIAKKIDELKLPFNPDSPLFMLMSKMEKHDKKDFQELHVTLEELFLSYGKDKVRMAGYCEGEKGVWFFQSTHSEIDGYTYIRGYLERIQEDYRSYVKKSVSLFLGHHSIDFLTVGEEYEKINFLVHNFVLHSKEVLFLDIDKPGGSRSHTQDVVCHNSLQKMIDDISDALNGRDSKQFERAYTSFLTAFKKRHPSNPLLTFQLLQAVSLLFITCVNKNGFALTDTERSRILDGNNDWAKYDYFYPQLGMRFCRESVQDLEHDEQDLIESIERYINYNIDRDISLTTLSAEFYFNPSYLSRFYSQHRGKKLSEFIKQTRIEKAMNLLRNPDLQVQDVSLAVGIDSAAYFASFFKKSTGKSPREYRLGLRKYQ